MRIYRWICFAGRQRERGGEREIGRDRGRREREKGDERRATASKLGKLSPAFLLLSVCHTDLDPFGGNFLLLSRVRMLTLPASRSRRLPACTSGHIRRRSCSREVNSISPGKSIFPGKSISRETAVFPGKANTNIFCSRSMPVW